MVNNASKGLQYFECYKNKGILLQNTKRFFQNRS